MADIPRRRKLERPGSQVGNLLSGPDPNAPPKAAPVKSVEPATSKPVKTKEPTDINSLPPDVKAKFELVKETLIKRSGGGFASLARLLRSMDDNHDCEMDLEEFVDMLERLRLADPLPSGTAALGGLGMNPSRRMLAVQAKTKAPGVAGTNPSAPAPAAPSDRPLTNADAKRLFEVLDYDGTGKVDVGEFAMLVRPEMNDRRLSLVKLAFALLDTDGSGIAQTSELAEKMDFSKHPSVVRGVKTADQALREFMAAWWDADGDGNITFKEFKRYYDELSASIDDDDYFELMIRNAWRISGGAGKGAGTAVPRALVEYVDGTKGVVEIQHSLGLKRSDLNELTKRLQRQGVKGIKRATFLGQTTEEPTF